MGSQVVKFVGEQGDGLITNELNIQNLKEKLLPAYKEGVAKSKNLLESCKINIDVIKLEKNYELMTKAVFMPASYNEDKQKALKSISFWKGAMIEAFFEVDIRDPREIQENGLVLDNDTMENMAFVISNAEEGIKN